MHYVKRLHTSEMLCSVHDKSKKPFRIAAYNLKVSTISIEHGFNGMASILPIYTCHAYVFYFFETETKAFYFFSFAFFLCFVP